MASSSKLGKPDPEGGLTPKGRALSVLARGCRPKGMTYKSYQHLVMEKAGEVEMLSEKAFKALPVEGGGGEGGGSEEGEGSVA